LKHDAVYVPELRYGDAAGSKIDSNKIAVRYGRLGAGIVAVESIPKGEFIAGFYGNVYPALRASLLPLEVRDYAIQFSEHLWRDSKGNARFLNHSCEPNCEVNGNFDVITSVPIRAGTDLTWDYSTTEDSDWKVPGGICLCGAKECRGGIPPYSKLSFDEKLSVYSRLSNWILRRVNCGQSVRVASRLID